MVADKGQFVSDSAEDKVQAAPDNPHPRDTPDYYVHELDFIEDRLREWMASNAADPEKPGMSPLHAAQATSVWEKRAKAKGIDLAEVALARLDPIRRLFADHDLVNHNEADLKEIMASIAEAEALGSEELDVKKKWLELIKLTLKLQRRARTNPVHFSIYVLRCQRTNRILHMEKIHVDIFRSWNDPDYPNSLEEAPPGVGKTTLMYGQDLFEMCNDVKLRFLKMCADLNTARNRLGVTRAYIGCRRLRALYPDVRVDLTMPDNQRQFTLIRPNPSQDPTMYAAGATSAIQGAGYDRLGFDDLCDKRVRDEPTTRQKITDNFQSVAMRRRRDFINARVRYICTPWHVDDTAAKLLRDIREGRLPQWIAHLNPVREKADGTPIPPANIPGFEAELLTVKRTDPLTYACCFLLNPSEQSLRYLKHLVYYDESGGRDPLCPPEHKERCARLLRVIQNAEQWQVLDPGAGGADEAGMMGFALGVNGRAAIRSARSFGGKSTEAIEPICSVVQGERADKVLIEGQGGTKGQADLWASYIIAKLGEYYRGRILISGTRFRGRSGKAVGQNISKGNRYRNVLPYLEDGTIMFPGRWEKVNGKPQLVCTNDPGLRQSHVELVNYPNVTSDHLLDCVTMFANFNIGRLVRRVKAIPQPNEPKKELPPTTNPLTLMRRQMEQRMLHPENYEKGVREQELEMLMAG